MTTCARLVSLGGRWGLDGDQVERLRAVLGVLADDPSAPTAVRGADAVDVHVADSLTGLGLVAVRTAREIADLGSGAGFPGIVLAIALPDAHVALVESAARKCEFLLRLCTAADVRNAAVVHARAEVWPAGLGVHDLVVARAVGPLAVLCEYAAPLLAIGGSLVAWKGALDAAERGTAARAAEQLGLRAEGTVRTDPYAGCVAHDLHAFRKVAETPAGYPRRAGAARKRPLGAVR